jgi:hypothetical protein
MENSPINGKSLWNSLRPGQKWAAIVGLPINFLCFKEYLFIVRSFDNKLVEVVLSFAGFFLIPWVYVSGLGLLIAVFIEFLFYKGGR